MADNENQVISSEQLKIIKRILNNVPAMIGYWDKDLKNKFSNNTYLRFFRMTSEEIYGKHIREVIGESLYAKNRQYIEGALRGEEQYFERDIPLQSGEVAHTQSYYFPDIQNGLVEGFYVMVTDVTPLKKIEKEKEEIYRKLIENSKMVSLGEMASGIAHEINNPLSVINLNATLAREVLSEETINKKQLEAFITNIQVTSNRIEKIVTGLQFFSQSDAQNEFNNESILNIINETTIFCLERFKSLRISFLQNKIDPNLTMECRATQISQVLLNLLNNSADAIADCETRWISIKAKEVGENIEISVSDSGRGVPEDLRDKIMQPFVTNKKVGKGTGLGLSISKGIVENHSGSLSLDLNAENTTFVISLPRLQGKV